VDWKKGQNNPTNKIGTEEDEVHGEEVGRATQMLNVLSLANMAITRINALTISLAFWLKLLI